MKKVAIVQSNYIPWKGYFDMIAAVDEFILYDDVQYTRRDWRNRNQIKTPQGLRWLSVPVKIKGRYTQSICDTEIDGSHWAMEHWKTVAQNYHKAPYFKKLSHWVEGLYLEDEPKSLSLLNYRFIKAICYYLEIETKISWSWDYPLSTGKTERLVSLCLASGATEYISGPSAKNYINQSLFSEHDIKLIWFDYIGYPKYPQLWGDFVHGVSILDLLLNCGKDSVRFMRY